MRVLDLDLIDDIDAEIQVNRFIAQDVLVLLGDAATPICISAAAID